MYDRLFDILQKLEQSTGIRMTNSPTQTVGYPAVSSLMKTTHNIPLLSLDKTKSVEELTAFQKDQQILMMLKLEPPAAMAARGRLSPTMCMASPASPT